MLPLYVINDRNQSSIQAVFKSGGILLYCCVQVMIHVLSFLRFRDEASAIAKLYWVGGATANIFQKRKLFILALIMITTSKKFNSLYSLYLLTRRSPMITYTLLRLCFAYSAFVVERAEPLNCQLMRTSHVYTANPLLYLIFTH